MRSAGSMRKRRKICAVLMAALAAAVLAAGCTAAAEDQAVYEAEEAALSGR